MTNREIIGWIRAGVVIALIVSTLVFELGKMRGWWG